MQGEKKKEGGEGIGVPWGKSLVVSTLLGEVRAGR